MNNEYIILIGITCVLAFIFNLYLTPLLIFLSKKHGLYDKVEERKIHTENTSRLGGISIYISFIISSLLSPILVSTIFDSSIQFSNTNFILPLLVLSTFIIFITGLLDDFTSMRARYKLVGQIIAALIAIMGGAVINYIDVPFTSIIIKLGPLSIPVTLLWIVGITNSINLIDGIDGLSSGISIIASMIFGMIFLLQGLILSSIVCFALMGSLFGYLFYNFPPAKIFMGDSGSLVLGFIFAVLPIATSPESGSSLVLPLTMLSIPILDVVSAIWRRSRDKRNIFSPDRFHMHHKMMNMGLNNRNILAIIYGICLFLGVIMILFELSPANRYFYFFGAWITVILFFIYLHYKKENN